MLVLCFQVKVVSLGQRVEGGGWRVEGGGWGVESGGWMNGGQWKVLRKRTKT